MASSHKIIIALAATIVCLIATNNTCAYEAGGFEYRSINNFDVELNKDWKTVFQQEMHFGNDGGHLYYQHYDLGLIYKGLGDWIDVGLNFRKGFKEDSADDWLQENRTHLNVTLKQKLGDIDVSMRNRLEFRDFENAEDRWRYRNKVTFKLPYELTSLKLKPYIADEIFINLNEEGYSANRLYGGLSFKLFDNIKTSVFYFWQSSRANPGRNDTHAIGTKLVFAF